jgi:hypothetical protein
MAIALPMTLRPRPGLPGIDNPGDPVSDSGSRRADQFRVTEC